MAQSLVRAHDTHERAGTKPIGIIQPAMRPEEASRRSIKRCSNKSPTRRCLPSIVCHRKFLLYSQLRKIDFRHCSLLVDCRSLRYIFAFAGSSCHCATTLAQIRPILSSVDSCGSHDGRKSFYSKYIAWADLTFLQKAFVTCIGVICVHSELRRNRNPNKASSPGLARPLVTLGHNNRGMARIFGRSVGRCHSSAGCRLCDQRLGWRLACNCRRRRRCAGSCDCKLHEHARIPPACSCIGRCHYRG